MAGGGAEKALEPAECRRRGGGGQERLYGKPTTKNVLWRVQDELMHSFHGSSQIVSPLKRVL